MKKVVALARSFAKFSDEPIRLLEKNGFEVICKPNHDVYNEEKIAELIGDADACIVGSDKVGAIVFEQCKKLQLVTKHGVGLNNIDLDLAKTTNISVMYAPGANAHSTAELTWLLIMAANRNLWQEAVNMKQHKGDYHATKLQNDLNQKTLGIVGFGNIGRLIKKYSEGFDMRVYVYDPYVKVMENEAGFELVDLDTLLAVSDIITLNAPATTDNFEMINQKSIAKMKDGVIIVNSSRGELINEQDLYEALTAGKVKRAGLDVFQQEPPIDNPLLALEQVIATPHIGGQSIESNIKLGMISAQNIVDFFGS